jgi:hypothetical protein
MNAKTTLVLIALIGVGLFALPQTTALFAGQHTFVNIDATGNQIDCVKCHGDIKAEMALSGTSAMTGTAAPHANFTCEYCHRVEAGSASGDNAYGQLTYTNGISNVILLVTLQDMEALNIPTSILANGSFNNSITESGKPMLGTYKVSSCYIKSTTDVTCTEDLTTTVLLPPEPSGMKYVPAYNTATHQPLDTNVATKNSGLDVSLINITIAPFTSKGKASSKVTYNLDGAGSRAVNPGSSYHAASLVSCMECHGGAEPMSHNAKVSNGELNNGSAICSNCHYGRMAGDLANASGTAGTGMFSLQAGGFGFDVTASDSGATEAHKPFQTGTDNNISRQKTINGHNVNNGACVACHTHVAVDITYNRPLTYTFTADTSTNGTTTTSGFSAQGTAPATYSNP